MEEKKEKRILQIELDDDLNEFPMQELKHYSTNKVVTQQR